MAYPFLCEKSAKGQLKPFIATPTKQILRSRSLHGQKLVARIRMSNPDTQSLTDGPRRRMAQRAMAHQGWVGSLL
jgi:hypothetical protein